MSLWNQQGSNVIRGNLLVIPVSESLLYVEPLYLQAANGKIPELKRVILATADRVVMEQNLGLALVALFGEDILADAGIAELATAIGEEGIDAVIEEAAEVGAETLSASTVEELILLANSQYLQADENLRAGNWTGYGLQMEALQATLEQLMNVTGVEMEQPEVQDEGAASVDAPSAPADDDAPAADTPQTEAEPEVESP